MSAVKERPIIMGPESVRAILDGPKSQTRRVVKPPPAVRRISRFRTFYPGDRWWVGEHPRGGWWAVDIPTGPGGRSPHMDSEGFPCPYGSPGDRLWVRETWAAAHGSVSHEYEEHAAFDWDTERHGPLVEGAPGLELFYRADGEERLPAEFSMPDGSEIRWRSPIHMPRWASRLTLEVTDIRVERVQEISEEDARAEGARPVDMHDPWEGYYPPGTMSYREGFAAVWDSLNAKRGYGWDENPWVWVVSFRRVLA